MSVTGAAMQVARDDRKVNVPIPGTLTDGSSEGWGMALWLPGYTVPWSHAIFLWLATCISVSMHEVRVLHIRVHSCSSWAYAASANSSAGVCRFMSLVAACRVSLKLKHALGKSHADGITFSVSRAQNHLQRSSCIFTLQTSI